MISFMHYVINQYIDQTKKKTSTSIEKGAAIVFVKRYKQKD